MATIKFKNGYKIKNVKLIFDKRDKIFDIATIEDIDNLFNDSPQSS